MREARRDERFGQEQALTLVAVVGDCTTTTALALAAGWPTGDEVLVVEADRTGGSIAAWLDMPVAPSLSTAVASVRGTTAGTAESWSRIEGLTRRSASGVWFLPAPVRSTEAARSIEEAEHSVFPTIARQATALVDAGRRSAADGAPAVVGLADIVVVPHRQATASANDAAVRIERIAELVEVLAITAPRIVVAVIGDSPFEIAEIHEYVTDHGPAVPVETHPLAVDELAAAVLAGRRGVSERRFARLPLVRTSRRLARAIAAADTPLPQP